MATISATPVQQANNNSFSGTTATIAISPTTTGNTVIIGVSSQAVAVLSIAGAGVTTFTSRKTVTNAVNGRAEIWSGVVTAGASTSIVVTFVGSADGTVWMDERAGINTTTPVDSSSSGFDATGSAVLVDPGSITPTAGIDCLIVAVGSCQSSTRNPAGDPTGFTPYTNGGWGGRFMAAYQKVASASGSYDPTWTCNYDRMAAVVVAFKAATGGGGQVPPISRGIFL